MTIINDARIMSMSLVLYPLNPACVIEWVSDDVG